jgi:2-polyprenyl-6-hydroxyphenyl methylase/3-demethylubiquinone-9 3-methyltransferase
VPYWLPWPRPGVPDGRREGTVKLNELSIYDTYADVWWEGRIRGLRTLQNMVPVRLAWFDPIVGEWQGKTVLDLGCGGGFMSEAMAARGAIVTVIDPSKGAIEIARKHASAAGLAIDYEIALGESLPLGPIDGYRRVRRLARTC